ncbi:MAG: 50S ribosomal protein L3 [Verrucomicrobia bacterium]|nr:50S ribosomal protein L3 [Verrucomicrobiota bacterium]MBI3871094.1 50S ribosomal protein L3 [Verrucomicrobiota bacterium]
MIALIGKKLGHTRVYDSKGVAVPVTVVLAGPNRVMQCKTKDGKDGYNAVQLGFDDQKESRITKPLNGHFKKFKAQPVKRVQEFRDFAVEVKPGDVVGVDLFQVGDFVDAIGVTKGRGFEGVVKRHGFRGGDMTHGAKGWHRRSGAIGCRLFPGHVNRGMKMPGHMGQARRTAQNLEVIQVRKDDNVLLIKGSMPGAEGDYVVIRGAKKMTREVVAERAKRMAERAKGKAKNAKEAKQTKK